MHTAYLAATVFFAVLAAFSGIGKLRRDPHQVHVIHETLGVPLRFLPPLAACELAGAGGLLAGIAWLPIGLAAATGLVLYFVGAVVSHLLARDLKGVGPAVFMLVLAVGALALRILAA